MNPARSFSLLRKSRLSIPSRASSSGLVCPSCLHSFGTTASQNAGHNKWSKTKHIKAVTDKKKMSDRVSFTKLITMYSKSWWHKTPSLRKSSLTLIKSVWRGRQVQSPASKCSCSSNKRYLLILIMRLIILPILSRQHVHLMLNFSERSQVTN